MQRKNLNLKHACIATTFIFFAAAMDSLGDIRQQLLEAAPSGAAAWGSKQTMPGPPLPPPNDPPPDGDVDNGNNTTNSTTATTQPSSSTSAANDDVAVADALPDGIRAFKSSFLDVILYLQTSAYSCIYIYRFPHMRRMFM